MDKENSVVFVEQTHIAINLFLCCVQVEAEREGFVHIFLWSTPLHPYIPVQFLLVVSWSKPLLSLSPVNTCHVPSPFSCTGRATCARAWRSPSTSLHTTSQNTTSVLHRPPSHQYRVIPQTHCFLLWLLCTQQNKITFHKDALKWSTARKKSM